MDHRPEIVSRLEGPGEIILEIGCGERKRIEGSIGIDVKNYECVDLVGDIVEVLREFPNESVDRVHSHHCFEHVRDLNGLFQELSRTVKKGGFMEIIVPHFSNPFFYSDPTHISRFGLYTFAYFAEAPFFRRNIPEYSREKSFLVKELKLVFKSYRPHYARHALKKAIEVLVNLSVFTMEVYEEMFCYMAPCYEIYAVLQKK